MNNYWCISRVAGGIGWAASRPAPSLHFAYLRSAI